MPQKKLSLPIIHDVSGDEEELQLPPESQTYESEVDGEQHLIDSDDQRASQLLLADEDFTLSSGKLLVIRVLGTTDR